MVTAGVDEAGRGPLAGPVVAVACILQKSFPTEHLKDSKLLSPKRREELFHVMTNSPKVIWAKGIASHEEVDQLNIHHATLLAMHRAIVALSFKSTKVLIDGLYIPKGLEVDAEAVVEGDRIHPVISAASILAKVIRDKMMVELDALYPQYGFKQHKGYGTKAHVAALEQYGPCPIHRQSFEPVKNSKK